MDKSAEAETLRNDELLIRRWLDAPVADVFRIWSDKDQIIRWWGPKDFTCTHFDMDFRVGGQWRACIVADAYGESWMRGEYKEIVHGERIVFSFVWEDGRDQPGVPTEVTVSFDARGNRTLQSFHQSPFIHVEARDSHIGGWNECFDNEENYLATANTGGIQ